MTSREQKHGRKLIVERASDVEIERIKWLWPNRFAIGKQSLIAGEAGLGKSQIALAMAAAVTTGREWPCGEGIAPCGNVVILSAEDGIADTVVPRLVAADADLSRVHVISAVQSDSGKGRQCFNLQTDLRLLEAKIVELGDVLLVIIDPLSAYLGKVDTHVNAAVRGVLEPIGEMAARLGVAVVSITHPPKAAGTAAVNKFIGSVAFVAAARAAFMVTCDPENSGRRLLLPVKNNLAPLGKGFAFWLEQRVVGEHNVVASCVAWESGEVAKTADEALRAAEAAISGSGERGAERAEAVDFLRNVLGAGPLPATEVKRQAQEAGVSERTLRRAKTVVGVILNKEGYQGEWTWSLPKGGHETPKEATKPNGHLWDEVPTFDRLSPSPLAEDAFDIPDFLLRRNGGGDGR